MRLRIEYADHNESFARCLPREGVVESTPSCSDSAHKWLLLRLDVTLNYEGSLYSHFLLASRWQGRDIGGTEPTSVFVLLVPEGQAVSNGFSYKQYLHVAWGMAYIAST
jgi:hypothetical protein